MDFLRNWRMSGLLLCLAFSGGFSLAGEKPIPLQKVRLMTAWFPQSQFAGYYVAVDQGIYKKYGLDVEIISGGPDKDQGIYLQTGKTDFAISWLAPAMVNREKGIPMVLVGQVMERSNLALVGWKERGIRCLNDLQGRRVSLFQGWPRPSMYAFLRAQNLDVELVPQYFTMDLFLRRGVDVASVMTYNEYNMLYLSGVDASELTLIRLSDLGFVFPEDGIYTLDKTLSENPEMTRKLVAATKEGWEFSRNKPELALASVMKRVNEDHLPTNITHMKMMLEEILASIFPEGKNGKHAGKLSMEDFESCAKQMKDASLLNALPVYEQMVYPGARYAP